MSSSNNLNVKCEYAVHVSKFATEEEAHKEQYVRHHPNVALLQHDINLESNDKLPLEKCNTLNLIRKISLYEEFEHDTKRADKNILLQITHGLHFMHTSCVFHGDINPTRIFCTCDHNQYIITDSLGRTLEEFQQIRMERNDSTANDIYMLGQLFYYVLSCGKKIFGDASGARTCKPEDLECSDPSDNYIAADLIQKMLEKNLTTKEILQNPLFWNKQKRVSFLRETVNAIIKEKNETGTKNSLQDKSVEIIGNDWIENLRLTRMELKSMKEKVADDVIIKKAIQANFSVEENKEIPNARSSVYQLLRFIRNSQAHFWETKTLVQDIYESHITGFWDFYSKRFPRLLLHVYDIMKDPVKGDMEEIYYNEITHSHISYEPVVPNLS